MGTLFIKYPNLKGFFASLYTFDCIRIAFLNSAMSTFFLSYGYNLKLNLRLLPFNYLFSPKDD